MTTDEKKQALLDNGYEFELYKDMVCIFAPNEIAASWDIPFGWSSMGIEEILKTNEAASAICAAYEAMLNA